MESIVSVMRFGWPYLRRYRTRLALGVLFSLLFAFSNGSFVWATRTLTLRFSDKPRTAAAAPSSSVLSDTVVGEYAKRFEDTLKQGIDPWLPRIGQPVGWRQMVGALFFLPVLVLARSVADYLSNYCVGWVSERVIRDLRVDIMEKLSTLSLDFFNRSSTGDLLTRINVDSHNLLRALRNGGADMIKESFNAVVLVGAMFYLDLWLTFGVLVLLPACIFPLMVLGRKARRAMAATVRANISQSSQFVELLSGIRVIKAFNLEKTEIDRFRRTSADLVRAGMKGVKAKELINPVIEVISMTGFGVLLIYIFKAGRTGSELATFLAAVLLFFVSMRKLANMRVLFEQAHVGVERLVEILGEKPKVVEIPSPVQVNGFKQALEFENVSFAYREQPVLRDLTLSVPKGIRLGVAGESGSGKTTLVNLLFRFYDPTHGRILLDGADLRELSIHGLRSQLALVSQDVTIFDQTVAENIACGRPGATRAEVELAAQAAFAHEFISALPQGYETRVGERGTTLSGGQKQRLAIARAFVRNAPILVLDEATAALDSKAEAEVQAAIDRLAEHRTVICVAHRLSTLSSMDRVVVFAEGRIIEEGGFDELVARNGAFAAMAARQGIFAGAK